MMKRYLVAYGGALAAFLVCDAVWLTTTGPSLYRPALGDLLADGFRPVPALLFYLVYLGGLTHLAVRPGENRPFGAVLADAALFGFVAYATYDLTNQATLRTWPTYLTICDLAWGTFVSTVGAAAGKFALRFARKS